ncbi:T9SS type A sorting domain-containing protein [Candidatus Poribacteria bacterium]|nr:T9SS type A sorting domain-containing protein [Candidatus Poribacteria bacterium]
MRSTKTFIAMLLVLGICVFAQAATIRVPSNYTTIQAAINAARNGDLIIVADGIYKGENNKNLDFNGKVITVESENGPESTIIDCENNGRAFYFHSGENNESVVKGFTIMNGSPGGNPIQIAVNSQTGEKIIDINAQRDFYRVGNDNDPAAEPGEIIGLSVSLQNKLTSSMDSVTATLKTDDPRVVGLVRQTGTQNLWNTVDLSTNGLTTSYGLLFGNTTRKGTFQYIGIDHDFEPLADQVHFVLDVKSGNNFVCRDEFYITIGADIIVTEFDVDEDLVPGAETPEDIDVRLRNMTSRNFDDMNVKIDWSTSDLDIDVDEEEFDVLQSGTTKSVNFEGTLDEDFKGFIDFEITIESERELINIQTFRRHLGMRSQFVAYWIEDDDNDDNDKENDLLDPGDEARIQIMRWNPTSMEVEDVETLLESDDEAIIDIKNADGDYDDLPPHVFAAADDDYELIIATEEEAEFDELTGREVEFTLVVDEDNEDMGEETFIIRIGGSIRYLPPEDIDEFFDAISDSPNISPMNNGNGRPEPGETIGIEVTLKNTYTEDIDEVEAELDSSDDVDIDIDTINYGEIDDDDIRREEFLVYIEEDFEGSIINFTLDFQGEIDGNRENLGNDSFAIPVWNTPEFEGNDFEVLPGTRTPITNPTADGLASAGYGGGICCINNSSPTIDGNIIKNNSANTSGGGIYCGNNSNPLIINNVMFDNSAVTDGGAIGCGDNSTPQVISNTITDNTAANGGGIGCRSTSHPTVLNTILWSNMPTEIFTDSSSSITVSYSDIQDGWPGTNNINSNPRFLNTANDNYKLANNSPAIATGSMALNVPETDIAGNPRPNPSGTDPDMGAYENSLPQVTITVTNVTPSVLTRGAENKNLTIAGSNFANGATVSFSGQGIDINSTSFVNSTQLTVNVDVADNAAVGSRNIIVTNPDGQKYTATDMFRIESTDAVVVSIDTRTLVGQGESFTADIKIADVTGLAGFQMTIVFDPDNLKVNSVEEGSFLSDSNTGDDTFWLDPQINNTLGEVSRISSARIDGGTASGSGVLIKVTFEGKSEGDVQIRIEDLKLSNPNGIEIPSVTTPVTIQITAAPPWDVNRDGIVDIFDFVIIGQFFGQPITGSPNPNPDVNRDSVVDIFDFVLVGQHFGETYTNAAPNRDIWSATPEQLPMLTKIHDIVSLSSDPKFQETKAVLERLISGVQVNKTAVFQNYPNPFNPETWIPFQLSEGTEVNIIIYNSAGQLVRTLDLGFRSPGYYNTKTNSAYWDGLNESGEQVSSGIYFYTIRAGEFTATRKMLMVK